MSELKKSEFAESFTNYLNSCFGRQKTNTGYNRNELIKVRRLDSLARIFNGNDGENCTAVCLYKGKLYVASNKDIFGYIKGKIQELKGFIDSSKIPAKSNSRDTRDMRKIVASITGIGRRKICTRTAGGSKSRKCIYKNAYVMAELVNIFANTDANIVPIENDKGLHAELCVMNHLIHKNIYDTAGNILFGISKLCCRLCACGMNAAGLIARTHYRAIHGIFYNKWVMPGFITASRAILKRFLGQEAYAIYKNHKLIRTALLQMIPTELGIASGRGGSNSCLSDSEEDSN